MYDEVRPRTTAVACGHTFAVLVPSATVPAERAQFERSLDRRGERPA